MTPLSPIRKSGVTPQNVDDRNTRTPYTENACTPENDVQAKPNKQTINRGTPP